MPVSYPALLILICAAIQAESFPEQLDNAKWLDYDGKYLIRWTVSQEQQLAYFVVEAATHGYVGFGLSPNGGMANADIVIGGVNADGDVYLSDRHGPEFSNGFPPEDTHQDWYLAFGNENETHTVIGFWRKLETCDPQDLPITESTTKMLYAWGTTDTKNGIPQYHEALNRGSKPVSLFAPKISQDGKYDAKSWDMRVNVTIPGQETFWWFQIFKGPTLDRTHHYIGADIIYTPGNENLVHHCLLFQCELPEWVDLDWLFKGGAGATSDSEIKTRFCVVLLSHQTLGMESTFVPEKFGILIRPDFKGSTYFHMQIHYFNPDLRTTQDNFGFRLYYTDKLRPIDAGIVLLGQYPTKGVSITIPPSQDEWVVVGHCSHQCTEKGLDKPINIVGAVLHAHKIGRKIIMRHFRNDTELPWIAFDNHYDFNYQEIKFFQEEVVLLPGDHVTLECFMNSSGRNSTTIGGISSLDEMCLAGFMYYPAQTLSLCLSFTDRSERLQQFGITKTTNDLDAEVIEPAHLRGMKYHEVVDSQKWTPESLHQFQDDVRYGSQQVMCFGHSFTPIWITEGQIRYPNISGKEYTPVDSKSKCSTAEKLSDEKLRSSCKKINGSLSLLALTFCSWFLIRSFAEGQPF